MTLGPLARQVLLGKNLSFPKNMLEILDVYSDPFIDITSILVENRFFAIYYSVFAELMLGLSTYTSCLSYDLTDSCFTYMNIRS